MKFTKEQLDKYRSLSRELKGLAKEVSDSLNFVKDKKNMNKNVEIEREGKKVVVKEKVLWDEVFALGQKCQAYKVLKGKYPKTFEMYEESENLKTEIAKYERGIFGFDHTKVSLSNYIDLTESLLEHLLTEKYGFKEKESVEGTAEWGDDDEIEQPVCAVCKGAGCSNCADEERIEAKKKVEENEPEEIN